MTKKILLCGLTALVCVVTALAKSHNKEVDTHERYPGLADATILIIRHAEKPDSGPGLAPEGEQRAKAYVNYFQNYKIGTETFKVDALIGSANSGESHRPELTLQPLSKALHLPIDVRFRDKDYEYLVNDLHVRPRGKTILICWHHGEIPGLLAALGADPEAVLHKGDWPNKVFSWVMQLRFDHDGHLLDSTRVEENLLPGDANGGR